MAADFPEWMLPEEKLAEYEKMQDLAIVEMAGRDSVAAAISAVVRYGYANLLPVYAYTGTEHGPWNSVEQAVQRLASRLPEVRVHPLLALGSPGFWRALNGRLISECLEAFGHYTPCPGCHLYLHAVRIPLARRLGNVPIIAGERKSHSGMVKINQVGEALDFYSNFIKTYDIDLKLPLADTAEGKEIEKILQMPWQRGKDQLLCCLSGNYKNCKGQTAVDTEPVMRYFNEFAGPAARRIINAYLGNQIPDHEQISKQVMTICLSRK